MIIGIDLSSVPYSTGVSNYTINLIRALLKLDRTNTYKLFFSSFRQPLPSEIKQLQVYKNAKIYHFPFPPTLMELLWNRLHLIPLEMFIGKCDVYHTWDWTQPPTLKAKTVTTVHDLVPFLYPKWQSQRTIAAHARKMKWAAKQAHGFICVSQATKTDLLKLFPQLSQKYLTVIPEAAEDKYHKFRQLPKSQQLEKIAKIKKQYGLDKFLLVQGTREPRKNLNRVIKAFIAFKTANPNSKTELAISGKYGWGKDINHLKHPYIKILGFIPEKDMAALHAAALALIYPSLYEGFGLPILKAFSTGTPVITSNLSSMPEVAGNAALLVNPRSVKDIQTAITRLIKSTSLRQTLVNRGFRQVNKFSWTKTAQATLDTYIKVAAQ